MNYTNCAIVANEAFGFGSQHFTAKYPGLFVLAAANSSAVSLQIGGQLGPDGQGNVDVTSFTTQAGGRTYTAFVKRVYNAGTPSVNHLVIVPSTHPNLGQEWSGSSGDDYHRVYSMFEATEVFYLLVSRQAGGFLDDAQMRAIADQFLSLLPPLTDHVGGLDFGNVIVGEVRGSVS